MWWHNGYDSSSTDYDILDINFVRISTSTEPNYVNGVASDCNGVKRYELLYAGDLNQDCNVNRADLYIFTNSWLECDDPNWRNCK